MATNEAGASGSRDDAQGCRSPSSQRAGTTDPNLLRAVQHLAAETVNTERRTASATQRVAGRTTPAPDHPERRTISATGPAQVRTAAHPQRPDGRTNPVGRGVLGHLSNIQQRQEGRQLSQGRRLRRPDSPQTAALRPLTRLEQQLNDAYVAYERHTYSSGDRESDEQLLYRICMANDDDDTSDYFMQYYKSQKFQQKVHREIRSLYVQRRENEAIALFAHLQKHLVVLTMQGFMAPHPMTGCRQILPLETSGPHVAQLGANVALLNRVISSNLPFLHPDGAALTHLLRTNPTLRTILTDLRFLSSLSDGATEDTMRALTVDMYLRESGHPFLMAEAWARWSRQFPLLATHLPELAGHPPGLTRTGADPTFGLYPYPTPPTPLYQIPDRVL